jgi:hypothetical protein
MIELGCNNTIHLDMNNFNNLVMDDWSWTSNWYGTNSHYSTVCSGMAVNRGFIPLTT